MPSKSTSTSISRFFKANARGFAIVFGFAVILALATDTFVSRPNLDSLGRQLSIFAILAVGELLVILTAGIDLSVGSIVGLSGIVVAQTAIGTKGIGATGLAIALALAAGAACGLFSGLLYAFLRIPPFIATLGVMGIARGMALLISGGRTIQPLPKEFGDIADGTLLRGRKPHLDYPNCRRPWIRPPHSDNLGSVCARRGIERRICSVVRRSRQIGTHQRLHPVRTPRRTRWGSPCVAAQ